MDGSDGEHIVETSSRGGLRLFAQCDHDPKGSVSKAWSLTLLFITFFFGFTIYEGKLLKEAHFASCLALCTAAAADILTSYS